MSNVLEKKDVYLFNKLYSRLLCYVSKQVKIFQSKIHLPNEFKNLPFESQLKIRTSLFNKIDYIDQFLKNEDAKNLTNDEFIIIESWKHFENDIFIIYKHYKNHSIFINGSDKIRAFAVLGIFDPLNELLPSSPTAVKAILLPFKNRIIYDGLLEGYPIHFGSGFRNSLKESYKKIKQKKELIFQLPVNKD